MKTTKKAPVKKVKKKSIKASSKRVPLVHQNRLILRQLRLVEHKHTGKIIHHKNTSHLSLIMILLIFGLFLFATGQYARAIINNGSVTVGLTVLGAAPKSGATITSPSAGKKFVDEKNITVSGVCEKKSFVVVKSNNSIVGSTNCTEAGIFSLSIQLQVGDNILSALNYDNLNQAGPETPSVTVSLSNTTEAVKVNEIKPTLPDNPSTVPGTNTTDCISYATGQLPTGNEPHVAVVCVPRISLLNIKHVMGILVWGGTPPYAVSVNWSDGADPTLISVASAGYKTVTYNYAVPKTYKISLKLKDHADKEAVVETAVQVYSDAGAESSGGIANSDDSVGANIGVSMTGALVEAINSGWFETPVPFYLLAVAVTLGFWFGDIFDRRYNNHANRKRRTA